MKLYQNKRPVKNREMFDFDFDSTSSSDYNIKKKNMIWESKCVTSSYKNDFDENVSKKLSEELEDIFYDAFESIGHTEESLIKASKIFKPITEKSGKNSWEQKHKDKMEIHRKQLELKRKEIEAKALHVKQKIEEDRLRIKEVMKKQRIELEKRRMDTVNEKKAEEAQIKFVLDYINNEFTEIQKDLKNISFKTYT